MEIDIIYDGKKWVLIIGGRAVLAFNSRASACMVRTILEIDGEVLGGEGAIS